MNLVQSTAPALATSALVLFLPAPAAIFFGVPAVRIAVNRALCRIIASLLSRTRPGRVSPNSDLAAFTVLTTIVIGKLFSDGSRSTRPISPDISLTGGVSRTLVSELNYDGAVPTILCTFSQRAAIRGRLRRHVPRDPVSIALPVIGEGAKVVCRNRGGKQIKKSRNKQKKLSVSSQPRLLMKCATAGLRQIENDRDLNARRSRRPLV
jgi:hypothetical protein